MLLISEYRLELVFFWEGGASLSSPDGPDNRLDSAHSRPRLEIPATLGMTERVVVRFKVT
jgi:hypothetical protein